MGVFPIISDLGVHLFKKLLGALKLDYLCAIHNNGFILEKGNKFIVKNVRYSKGV